MFKARMEVIVQPSFWFGNPRISIGTFEGYWQHMITFETRAKQPGIEHFICIFVYPKEALAR
jgi:predicted metal-dependent TIM-barrel fold hydrolase